ncbi:MAG: LPS export ABC transporter periplasmic protein LptC [Deltaproteobacteria bacterium RBG_13_47_9]|nr:MAG: LPS export ABC transporter periplasmic protein LptC [Deltaproteobacteria bacterium RBG_13_47_9]
MKKAKILILISIVLIGGIVLVSLWVNLQGKKASEEGEVVPKISTDGADARLEKIRFVEDKHGQKTWELEAKSIQQYQGQNIMLLEEVKVTFFTKEGQSFIISGNKGKVYQDSKNMELVGDVVLTSSDGYRLKTHSISYHNSEKKVTTSDTVEIEGEQIRLVGKGMWVDMEAKIFKVLNQVKTQWRGGKKG